MSNKKWLITGGCGFIGRSLIRAIIDNQAASQIIVLDNLSVGSRDDLSKTCEYSVVNQSDKLPVSPGVYLVEGDILDPALCIECASDVDNVVHLAANSGVDISVKDPRKDMENNVIGIFNMLNAARIKNVKKFIFASSGAPLGEVVPPIHEEVCPHPVSPYGASKLCGEAYCSSFFHTYGLETIALRFGNVYGPGSYKKSSVVAKFIKQTIDNQVCEIYGDGSQTRDFIYIDDIVGAIICASNTDVGGQVFQIATGREHTVNEIAEKIGFIFNNESDYKMRIVNTGKRLGDVQRNYSDVSKAENILKWKSLTPIDDGLSITVHDIIKNNNHNFLQD